MKIQPHAGYIQISYPELLSRSPRLDNINRLFTAIQPGSHNLLVDVSGHAGPSAARDRDDARHFARALADAFQAMSDSVELLAMLCRADQLAAVKPYVDELQRLGYGMRIFTQREHAEDWIRAN